MDKTGLKVGEVADMSVGEKFVYDKDQKGNCKEVERVFGGWIYWNYNDGNIAGVFVGE